MNENLPYHFGAKWKSKTSRGWQGKQAAGGGGGRANAPTARSAVAAQISGRQQGKGLIPHVSLLPGEDWIKLRFPMD